MAEDQTIQDVFWTSASTLPLDLNTVWHECIASDKVARCCKMIPVVVVVVIL